MHESSLARRVVELVLRRATESGAARVLVVRGRLAETEALSKEALELHFRTLARGTAAESARLDIAVVHARARCSACETTYLPDHVLLCPLCGNAGGELLDRTGLTIESIEVEGEA